ncbi:MAG: hypothetical protein JSS57_14880 [Proteobacteria bacterium]|nr:hypothetical protein [Pseudomonadota bacterium]
MGGKKVTTGYWYELAWHDGLCLGPLDAYLEFRAGTKTAWSGRETYSTTIYISAPDLWGGEKDQGGIVGPLSLMFGDATQTPSPYLVSTFGDQTTAWRGVATVVFEGGKYGANNPYAQKRAHKVERIKQGWDGDACWYPAKAAVPIFESGGGSSGGAIYPYKVGRRVIVTSPGLNDPGMCTQEMADNQGFAYAITDEYLWFWRDNESGLTFAKTDGESNAQAVNYFVDRGLGYGKTALLKFMSGVLHMIVLLPTLSPPPPLPGVAWANDGLGAHTTAIGGVYLWSKPLEADTAGPDLHVSVYSKNPAHMLLWAHTQEHCGGQPLETVNIASATAAADWFYAHGFGLCTIRYPDKESAAEFSSRIERVAGCAWSQNRADGQWYIDIANGEYDIETLPTLTDDDIVSFEEIPTVLDDAVNSVSIKYFDPQRKEIITTPPLRAMGLIAEFGTIHQTYDFQEIPTDAIANRVAHRELLARCTPTRVFTLATTRKTAGWRRNTYFRLQCPKRGIADMVCLLAEINSGSLKSGAVQIKATQDIYSLPTTAYATTETGVDTRPPSTPAPITAQAAFEAPYIDVVAAMPASDFSALPKDAGYLVGAAVNPGRMRDFTMTVAPSGGAYAVADDGEFSPSCTATAAVEPGLRVGIGFSDGVQMSGVAVGDLALWDTELVRVDAIDLDAGTLDLGRGCADTLPHPHAADSRLFFYQHTAAQDSTQHIAGETVDVKLLTNSFSKQLSPADATAMHVTFNERIARPYPPADFKLNGVSVYAVGTPSTGGGGGSGGTGGGGGTGTPTSPPATTPNGTPASTTPGPNGGYPDNAPYPIPSPPVGGTDVMPDGDFTDPASIDGWMLRSNSQPLGPEWSIVGGRLQFHGAAAGYNSIAVCKLAKYSLGANPMPRYRVTVRAKLAGEPGVMLAVGVTGIGDYMSTPAEYITETVVQHVFEWRRQSTGVTGDGRLIYQDVMPVISIAGPIGSTVLATADDAEMSFDAISIPETAEIPDHIAFDAGLAGWTNLPNVPGVTPALSVSAGVLTAETIGSGVFQYIICDDPIALADVAGKYVKIEADCWCDDPTILAGINTGGVRLGIMAKDSGTYTQYPITNGVWQRGDFTQRTAWVRVPTDATGALTWHVMVGTKASLGYKCKVRNITVHVTDSVVTD